MEPSFLTCCLLVVLEFSTKMSAAPKPGLVLRMSPWDHSCPRLDTNFEARFCRANISWERSSAKDIATADRYSLKSRIEAQVSPPPGVCPVPDPSSQSRCSLVRDEDGENSTACPGPLGSCATHCFEWDDKGACHAGRQKPGLCPPVVHDVLCIQFVEYCSADPECPDLFKCCDAKCERRCMPPLEGGHKLGLCPLLSDRVVCTRLEESCKSDLGCPGEHKCCLVPCGRACVQPRPDSIKNYIPFK